MKTSEFILAPKYRLFRHALFWVCFLLVLAVFWTMIDGPNGVSYGLNCLKMLMWWPVFMLYSYPVTYFGVHWLLLKNRYAIFISFIIIWAVLGYYLNILFRSQLYYPLMDRFHLHHGKQVVDAAGFLCMTTTAGSMTIVSVTKIWVKKQQQWYRAEQEKVTAQLQLLKAQLHPHFLFNTLNNIYGFALEQSEKTPQLILKLSALLSYMLYECRTDEVLLEKEVSVMKSYIDLEKERYGHKIDISLNIEGDIQDKYIAPLLILPFLENAFKHGTSEQLERPWLSLDIVVKENLFRCKVVNSKNERVPFHENGVGINNVQKRLEFLYPGRYQLKLADEGVFFMVSLVLELQPRTLITKKKLSVFQPSLKLYS